MQHVALGALLMLIENIDLKVGVANGTIGIVTKLEFFKMLSYAITGHKSQGATISSKVMICIRKFFA
jgi:ATP-dependent exoDNAse (exonuclease V) alpha subunit